jgi:hypothetical protein
VGDVAASDVGKLRDSFRLGGYYQHHWGSDSSKPVSGISGRGRLPADADLTRNIRQALENSALLVVICSPRAVQSRFVAEEIRYFKELGKADRILALMIDGEPNA